MTNMIDLLAHALEVVDSCDDEAYEMRIKRDPLIGEARALVRFARMTGSALKTIAECEATSND